ncbi:MAG: glycosyltransferase [Bacillota bacterium]
MHILMLHQYFSTEGNGPENRFFEIGRYLASQDHQVTVLTGNSRTNLDLGTKKIGLLQTAGMAVIAFNNDYHPGMSTGEKRRSFISYARSAARQGRRLPRPDLILASSPPLTTAWAALSTSKHYRVPLFLEIRELWPDAVIHRRSLRNKTLISLARRLEQKAYRQAACILAPAPGIAEAVRESVSDRDKVVLLPDYLDSGALNEQFSGLLKKIIKTV